MELFGSIFEEGIGPMSFILASLIALACGAAVAAVGSIKSRISKSFLITLVVLPFAVETVILLVNGNIGTGIAVAGAFSLVRFRSVPGKASDILYIFTAMTAGLACATGYIVLAILFTIVCCFAVWELSRIRASEDRESELRITVPENLNFTGAFDDIFEKYTKRHTLSSVKSSNMGSLYKLSYVVEMKDEGDVRAFIDELRVRNGNLEIALFKNKEGTVL